MPAVLASYGGEAEGRHRRGSIESGEASARVPDITAGSIHAFYLFDVAQAIDLARLRQILGPQATSATLQDKTAGLSKVRYFVPPVMADADAMQLGDVDGFRPRLKWYDYGVVSVMLSRPFVGSWAELTAQGHELIESEPLERKATALCRDIVERIRAALVDPRESLLSEDYLVFVVHELERPVTAEAVVQERGGEIAQLLRGERQMLSKQERDEVLKHGLSYLADDLVVPAYNAAFVLDTVPGAAATLEILEFVNSQLLEFRYHDELLETELTRIYSSLQRRRWTDRYLGKRPTQAARRLHSLFVDVNELTDRMENAVKLVGDVYAARLANLAGARLGLEAWKRNVEDKLKTLDDIYRFSVEQTGMSQGNLLELVIVLILVLELLLLLAGILQ